MNHEKLEKLGKDEKYNKIIYREESYELQGAIFEVYKTLGPGFLEAVYQECLENELALRDIPFQSKVDLSLRYKERKLNQTYRADLLYFNTIIIEIKAVSRLLDLHRAQVINYLKATGLKLGILVNFNSYPKVEFERIVI